MIELRYFVRNDPAQSGTQEVLQYRQQVDVNVYAGLNRPENFMPNMQWLEWRDVPKVVERDPSCP